MGDLIFQVLVGAVATTAIILMFSLYALALEGRRWLRQNRETQVKNAEVKDAQVNGAKAASRAFDEIGRKLASGAAFGDVVKTVCLDPECPEHGKQGRTNG